MIRWTLIISSVLLFLWVLTPNVAWLSDRNPYQSVDVSTISIAKKKLILSAEDPDFYKHHGFDFKRIKRAARWNLDGHRPIRGASTISQQLVKSLFLNKNERTWSRKFTELLITIKLERALTKDRIFALYVSLPDVRKKFKI